MPLLSRGNTKLGEDIWGFSIPAEKTCPGASEACKLLCYAKHGHYHQTNVIHALARNLEAIRSDEFVPSMVNEIRMSRVKLLRIHVSGDFESAEYTRCWLEIVRKCRGTRFFFYTRSWTDRAILPALIELGQEPNVDGWFSCDATMSRPPKVRDIRHAWMARHDGDWPPYKVDLVFRHRPKTPLKRAGRHQTLICPKEQGVTRQVKMTCTRCRICFTRKPKPKVTRRKKAIR